MLRLPKISGSSIVRNFTLKGFIFNDNIEKLSTTDYIATHIERIIIIPSAIFNILLVNRAQRFNKARAT